MPGDPGVRYRNPGLPRNSASPGIFSAFGPRRDQLFLSNKYLGLIGVNQLLSTFAAISASIRDLPPFFAPRGGYLCHFQPRPIGQPSSPLGCHSSSVAARRPGTRTMMSAPTASVPNDVNAMTLGAETAGGRQLRQRREHVSAGCRHQSQQHRCPARHGRLLSGDSVRSTTRPSATHGQWRLIPTAAAASAAWEAPA